MRENLLIHFSTTWSVEDFGQIIPTFQADPKAFCLPLHVTSDHLALCRTTRLQIRQNVSIYL